MLVKRAFVKILALVAVVAATTLAAKAGTLSFTLTGEGATYTFSLPSSPLPDIVYAPYSFIFNSIDVTSNGVTTASEVDFYSSSYGFGGFKIPALIASPFYGPQLYTGPETNPTFSLGNFDLVNSDNLAPYTLGIAEAASPVPEPSSLVLLASGGLALLGVGRRRLFSR
jgi:hypothetical protein